MDDDGQSRLPGRPGAVAPTGNLDADILRQVLDNIREVFWMSSGDGSVILYVSPGYERIWGRPRERLYAHPTDWLEAIHVEDRQRVAPPKAAEISTKEWDMEYRIVRPDGSIRWIHDRAFPVRDAHGTVYRIVGLAEDITERRKVTEHLRQTQKMEAIGQLAGGIAHDFNNILTALLMQVDLAASPANLPEDTLIGLAEIRTSVERAAALTKQLLLFSRGDVINPSALDLNEQLWRAATMLRRLLGDHIRVDVRLHAQPVPVMADANMLDQLVVNLGVNARDAMPNGGTLVLETTLRTISDDEQGASPDAKPGRYARLTVRDTGSGIPAGDLPRIFEPFFTTKPAGHGTGLGLATVLGVARQHGGWVDVSTVMGEGSSFDVYFPLAGRPEDRTQPPEQHPTSLGGQETILLVEDELFVRRSTRRLLERNGYRVLEAMDGDDALRTWQEYPHPVDLVFADIEMPGGMNGIELAQRLRAQRPNLKVLLTSGHAKEWPGHVPGGLAHFLEKPGSTRRVLEAVRCCLDE